MSAAVERYVEPVATHAAPLTTDQLKYIANTDLIPKAYRGNLPAMMACILTGRALGLDDLHALRAIHVVDGKATLSAELMVTLVRRAGHSLSGEMSADAATARGKRKDTGDEMVVTWSLEDATRAGLAGKQNWAKYPQSMLWARAVSQLVRMLFPDAMLGLAYTADEMGDDGTVVVDAIPVGGSVLSDGRPALDGPGETFEGIPVREPEEEGAAEEASEGAAASSVISDAQRRRLHAIRNTVGMTEAHCKALVLGITGQSSTAGIPQDRYEEVIAAIEASGADS